jgi:hypothetical protein
MVVLAAALYLLVLGGYVQAWVFTDGYAPKPALFDLLEPFPLWPVGVLILAPLAMIGSFFTQPSTDLINPETPLGAIAVGLYMYVISASLIGALRAVQQKLAS